MISSLGRLASPGTGRSTTIVREVPPPRDSVSQPLVGHRNVESTIAIRNGRHITVAEFLTSAWDLAARLPAGPYLINLCADRYLFAVGFAAALFAKHVSLLPTCQGVESLRSLGRRYPGAYILSDQPCLTGILPHVVLSVDATPPIKRVAIPSILSTQVAAIVFTSGSTGVPHAHAKTWGSLIEGANAFSTHFTLTEEPPRVVIGTVPAQHMYGLESTVMLPFYLGWMVSARNPSFPADLASDRMADPASMWLMTTPVHLRAYAERRVLIRDLEGIVSATMPLPPVLAASLEQAWKVPIYEVYGCTEGGMIAGRRPARAPRWTLCERLTLRWTKGTAWISGGHVGAPLQLMDHLTVHNHRQFTLHGRADDMVKIAGKRGSLAGLNAVLTSIPGVRDGVYYRPVESPSGVRRLSAVVVAPGMTKRSILNALRAQIDPVFLPRPMHLVDALPRNAAGKLARAEFEELIRNCSATGRRVNA